MRKALHSRGFTFVELMLVTAILGVTGLALYGTFTSGINIWKRITQRSELEDINLFFEKISFDLRNSMKLTGMRFRGGRTQLSFPTRMKFNDGEQVKDMLGEVTYSLDKRKQEIHKTEADYSAVYLKRAGKKRVLAQGIHSLQFHYYAYDQDNKQYVWLASWQEDFGIETEDNLPLLVRIELSAAQEGQEAQKYVRTVVLPSACCWPFEGDSQ